MAGPATAYFTQKRAQYQQITEQAQTAATKIAAANQALQILAQPSITPAQAEELIAYYTQAD